MASSRLPRALCQPWARSSLRFLPPSPPRFSNLPSSTAFLSTDAPPRSAHPVSLVAGASRGLGLEFTRQLLSKHPDSAVVATCRTPESADNLTSLKEQHPSRLTVLRLDVTEENTIEAAAKEILDKFGRLDLVLTSVGVLHVPDGMQPEADLHTVERANLLHAYKINAIGPIIVAKHMMPLLKLGMGEGTGRGGAVLANITCKVGSLRDNRLGGWYAYRASKAALNQFTRTLGVECLRRKEPVICVTLHPGAVDTELSRPYLRNIPEDKLFSPETSVEKLLDVIDSLKMEDAAKFFAYNRQEIPW